MQEVDKLNNFLIVGVIFLAGGLVGIKWLTLLPMVAVGWFFLADFHAGSKNPLADGANILFLLLALAFAFVSQLF